MSWSSEDIAKIVHLARERSLDDAPMLALRVLTDAFPALGERELVEVLVDAKTMDVDAGGSPRVVPKEWSWSGYHQTEVRNLYSNHVLIDGRWYAAYGAVTDLGEKDVDAFLGLTRSQSEMAFRAWAAEQGSGLAPEPTRENMREACRPMRYAKKPLQDLLLYLDTGPETADIFRKGRCPPRIPVLFRPVETPPPWAVTANDPQEAFDAGHSEGMTVCRYGAADRWDPKEEDELEELDALPEPRFRRFRSTDPKPDVMPDLEALRSKITAQAEEGAGFLTLDWGDGPVHVPRAPFERWALRPSPGRDDERLQLAPGWENVCPPSLKMVGDNLDHSDWMVGAGLEPGAMYSNVLSPPEVRERSKRIRDAAESVVAEVQRIRLGRKHAVLSGSGRVSGPVWFGKRGETPLPGAIVVVASANPDWLPAVMAATEQGGGGLVVERGGALAHLVSELRARAVPILRWPGAMKELSEGVPLSLDLDHGLAEVLPYDIDLVAPPGFHG